ncbi:MAG TPA: succinate dehydrogenase, cytochrome b556 subunit [Caulobacteraceae bacterium]|nr:succinate dehydrogenase, cytochrome b556 subunit [Caulobacteraceae bacterium]
MSNAAPAPRGPADRPISPHLEIWRWHITMATSILHRATGLALYAGALILAGWAVALARGPGAFGQYRALLAGPLGQLVLFGLTVSLFYHLANGVRHLWWDAGQGFEPKTADMTGAAAIAFGVVAAIAIWVVAIFGGAAG